MSKDHIELGRAHGRRGVPRYKFQDPYLQEQYNKGYDAMQDEDHLPSDDPDGEMRAEFARRLMSKQNARRF